MLELRGQACQNFATRKDLTNGGLFFCSAVEVRGIEPLLTGVKPVSATIATPTKPNKTIVEYRPLRNP